MLNKIKRNQKKKDTLFPLRSNGHPHRDMQIHKAYPENPLYKPMHGMSIFCPKIHSLLLKPKIQALVTFIPSVFCIYCQSLLNTIYYRIDE